MSIVIQNTNIKQQKSGHDYKTVVQVNRLLVVTALSS